MDGRTNASRNDSSPAAPRPLLAAGLAEFAGTAGLVGAGVAAIAWFGGSAELPWWGAAAAIGLSFGAAVCLMILAFAGASGAHINPAVTLALASAHQFPWRRVPAYVAAQSTGAVVGCALAGLVMPPSRIEATGYGVTAFSSTAGLAGGFSMEAGITAALVLTVLLVSNGLGWNRWRVALAIGAVVAVLAAVFGPLTGASMNPARSLGPAVVAAEYSDLWAYMVAPALGGLAAIPLCMGIRGGRCCRKGCA